MKLNLIWLLLLSFTAMAQPLSTKTFFEDQIIMDGDGALTVPSGTTGQRPSPPVEGMFRYNTTDGKFEQYEGGLWINPASKVNFADDEFVVHDDVDVTKEITFNAGLISTGTTRNYLFPDADGNIPLLENTQTFLGVNSFSQDVLMVGTGQFQMPAGTTAQRSGSPVIGMQRYNTDLGQPEIYNGASWEILGSSTSIIGPVASTDNAIVRYDGVTGKLAQDSAVIVDDLGRISQPSLNLATYFGVQAGLAATDGTKQNTGFGFQAGSALSTGNNSTFVGSQAGRKSTVGINNTAFGSRAYENNQQGDNNTAIGYRTLQNHTQNGGDNTAVGMYSQRIASSGFFNTTVGVESLENNITGDNNTIMGYKAGTRVQSNDNVAFGVQALGHESGGSMQRNVAIGARAGLDLRSGTDNILIGADVEAPSGIAAVRDINIGDYIIGNMDSKLLGIGVPVPTVALDVDGSAHFTGNVVSDAGNSQFNTIDTIGDVIVGGTGQIQVPSGTTAQRNSTPIAGMIRYNTDLFYFEGFNGAAWVQMETGAAASGDVVGPLVSTDNALPRYDGITGKIIQDSLVVVDDLGNVSGINDLTGANDITAASISVASTTSASHPCPTMNEVQRDLLTPALGDCVINTDSNEQNMYDGSAWISFGNVIGPASATDNAVTRYDATTGKILQDSLVIIDDLGEVSGVTTLNADIVETTNLNITSTTEGSISCPVMSEVQRDTIVAPVKGDCVFNSDSDKPNYYTGAVWYSQDGDVVGPAIASDNALARYDGTTGKIIQDGPVQVTDLGVMTGVSDLSVGKLTVSNTGEASTPCPVMTEVQRDALTPAAGECVFNSDTGVSNVYDGAAWIEGGGGGGGTFQEIYEDSTSPQIVLDGTRNGLVIQDNGTPIAVPLFTVETNAGADFFNISADQVTSTNLDVIGRLEVTSVVDASIPCPVMTEVQRDALTPTMGDCVFNSDVPGQQNYNGSAWISLTPNGLPVMAKGSLYASNGVANGEFGACADTEILEWDAAEAAGFKCVAKPVDTNTNAGTICAAGEYLDGDGSCYAIPVVPVIPSGYLAVSSEFNYSGQTTTFNIHQFTNIDLEVGYYAIEFIVPEPPTITDATCALQMENDGDNFGSAGLRAALTDTVLTNYNREKNLLYHYSPTTSSRERGPANGMIFYNSQAGQWDSIQLSVTEGGSSGDWSFFSFQYCSVGIRKI